MQVTKIEDADVANIYCRNFDGHVVYKRSSKHVRQISEVREWSLPDFC